MREFGLATKKKVTHGSSTFPHWDHLIEGSDATPMKFYMAVEEAILRPPLVSALSATRAENSTN